MLGKEPPEITRDINHTRIAVEHYLQHFSHVLFLAGKGFQTLQIAFTVGISTARVNAYLECYQNSQRNHQYKSANSPTQKHWRGFLASQ
jgi:hypothetical protein